MLSKNDPPSAKMRSRPLKADLELRQGLLGGLQVAALQMVLDRQGVGPHAFPDRHALRGPAQIRLAALQRPRARPIGGNGAVASGADSAFLPIERLLSALPVFPHGGQLLEARFAKTDPLRRRRRWRGDAAGQCHGDQDGDAGSDPCPASVRFTFRPRTGKVGSAPSRREGGC